MAMVLLPDLLLAYTCGYLLCMLDAHSGFAQASALDLSQNGIGHFGIPRQHFRLDHVSTLMVGCRGDCGSGHSSNINKKCVFGLENGQNCAFSLLFASKLDGLPFKRGVQKRFLDPQSVTNLYWQFLAWYETSVVCVLST